MSTLHSSADWQLVSDCRIIIAALQSLTGGGFNRSVQETALGRNCVDLGVTHRREAPIDSTPRRVCSN